MKNYLVLFIIAHILVSCKSKPAPETIASNSDTITVQEIEHKLDFKGELDSTEWEWGIYYVIISDTGSEYSALRNKMFELSKSAKMDIDTMDRGYNVKKGRLVLPDNHEDEMYAGEYFPRRYDSDFLSIEYLNFYTERAGENTMAVIAGIYEDKSLADSAYLSIRQIDNKALLMRSKMYIGCMH